MKMKYTGKEINKWISMKVYLVETVQHRVCVCVRARECHPSLKKLKHSSPFFLYAQGTASNRGTTFYSWKGYGDAPSTDFKNHKWLSMLL